MGDIVIPEDLSHLRDFPTYDITLQDSPKFRQNLKHWTFKTDKVGSADVYIIIIRRVRLIALCGYLYLVENYL